MNCSTRTLNDTIYLLRKNFSEEQVPYPRVLNIELTTRCNLRCMMCPKTLDGTHPAVDGDIEETVFQKVTEEVLPHVRQVVLSFLGEPLMQKKYFRRLLEECYERRIAVSLVTNGLLLDQDTVDFIIDKQLLEMNVSVDAADSVLYRQIRGGDFSKLLSNLSYLNKAKKRRGVEEPYVKLSFVAMKRNISSLPDFVRLAPSLGIKEVVIQSLHVMQGLENEAVEISDRNGNSGYIVKACDEGRKLGVKVAVSPDFPLFDEPFPMYKSDAEDFVCRLPWTTMYIDRTGNVRPCCGLPPLGNVAEEGMDNVWFGKRFERFRKQLVMRNAGYCRDCTECMPNRPETIAPSLNLRKPYQLGNGWYHLEQEHDQDYRWTGDKASFYLKPNGGKTLLVEYRGIKNGKENAYSNLSLDNEFVCTLDHSQEIAAIPLDIKNQKILKFDLETRHPVIPWNQNRNYPDPRLLGLRIGFAGIVHPVNFGNKISVLRVESPHAVMMKNQEYRFRVYWKRKTEMQDTPYVFFHFIHDSARFVKPVIGPLSRHLSWFRNRFLQFDLPLPVESLTDGRVNKNVFMLQIPETQQPGLYHIYMGCWCPGTSRKRLKTTGGNGADYLLIDTVRIAG